ncbi:MAG: response regulator transcription factor [Ideonella sp.]|jgi:DNA-binding NarL/FixJ family response regulator|nr:response regulator transcription factor [Ideonella sp.]MBL0148643.1 response regulator transcription factor [Ideonella sp.]
MTNTTLPSVLMAGWDPKRSAGWRRALEAAGGWRVRKPASTLAELQSRALRRPPQLVITDLRMPDGPATELIRALRCGVRPLAMPILVVTRQQDPLILDALQEGADGVLDLSEPNGVTLAEHARNVMNGGADIAPWIARRLLDHFGMATASTHRAAVESVINPLELTAKERELLRHISIGRRLAEVGQAAQLAPSECSAAQVRAIYRKMQWRLRAGDLHLNTRH